MDEGGKNGLLLEVRDLRKVYGKRPVVKGVSFNVGRGEIVGLLGPNGAGKTTTFRMTVGLVRPDGGTVLLDGRDIAPLPMYKRARAGIGYLPQESSIFKLLTVEDNIRAILEHHVPDRAAQDARVDELIGAFGLEKVRESLAVSLSGGERRRLEIARALTTRPQLMLLDEPFAAIDPITVAEIQGVIKRLKDMGMGILLTDHSVRETLATTDRAYIIDEGEILVSGKPDEVVAHPVVRKRYLGEEFRL